MDKLMADKLRHAQKVACESLKQREERVVANVGNPLSVGFVYFNQSTGEVRVVVRVGGMPMWANVYDRWELEFDDPDRWDNDSPVCFRLPSMVGFGDSLVNYNTLAFVDSYYAWELLNVLPQEEVAQTYQMWRNIMGGFSHNPLPEQA